ncbi:MAG: exosortase A [Gammaproteobacteria bacterium]|nr:exosortase A [Gammaproteobacteria bacterium]
MEMNPLHSAAKEQQSSSASNLRNTYIGVLIVATWAMLFWSTIVATITIWSTSETFAHGFVILPIVGWLFFRDRAQFLRANVVGSYWGMAVTVGFILLWLIGQLLEVSVFRQLGVFGGIVASYWMVFGDDFAKHYKFPLCYVIFAVPFGNAIIPLLQHITAEITVFMLQVSQIPVFYEGLYLTIPSGKFEVAVACSGIRYLIASLAVGTLYAYLNYRYFYKQLLFVILAFFIPIIANGIRAYLIVIIAHLSDMEYATGADHLVYGWLFFGIVILLMFYLGSFFCDSEPEAESRLISSEQTQFNVWPTIMVAISGLVALLFNRTIDSVVPPQQPAIIKLSAPFNMTPREQTLWGIDFSHSLAMYLGRSTNKVELYVAKFANRQTQGELLTSTNLLYDQQYWSLVAKTIVKLPATTGSMDFIELQLVNAQGLHRLVRYSYLIDGTFIASQARVRLSQGLLALTGSSLPLYVVAVSVAHPSSPQGLIQGQQLLSQWVAEQPLSSIKSAQSL